MSFYNLFPFYNELDLLEIRLHTMPYVTKFVLCEMDREHSGKQKPYFFDLAKDQERFAPFLDKIVHLKVKSPNSNNAWANENFQRDYMSEWLKANAKSEDLIIVQDADEILSEDFVDKIEGVDLESPIGPQLHFYRYYVNAEILDQSQKNWMTGPLFKYEWLQRNKTYTLTGMRDMHPRLRLMNRQIFDCGWHFTFLGGAKKISEKMKAYAHQESNTDFLTNVERIEEALKNQENACDPRGVGFVKKPLIGNFFPQILIENQKKFSHLIL